MAIQFVGGASASNSDANRTALMDFTALSGGIDSSVRTNDVVLVFVCLGSTVNRDLSISGYTELVDIYQNGSDCDTNFGVYYKTMGATPDSSLHAYGSDATNHAATTVVYAFRGVDTTTPIDVTTTTTQGAGSAGSPPAITPVTSGAVVVVSGGIGDGLAPSGFTAPTGYSSKIDAVSEDVGFNSAVFAAYKAWSGSGTETPGAWSTSGSASGDTHCAATIALRPGPVAGSNAAFLFNFI